MKTLNANSTKSLKLAHVLVHAGAVANKEAL